MANYYQILEISEQASADEIKKAYRRLAKIYHPDLNSNEGAQEKFIEIEEAYTCLSNSSSRRIYDRLLSDLRSGRTGSANTSQRREQQYQKRRSRARANARYHSKMSYAQYRRDEKYRISPLGRLLKFFLNVSTAILLIFPLVGLVDLLWAAGINPDHGLFGISVFLIFSAYIISVVALSVFYDNKIRKWILKNKKK